MRRFRTAMPFTPFHLGPGLLFKAAGGRHLSFLVFGFSQVAMDLEVGIRIVRGDAILHGFTHTFLGATIIGAVSAVAGRPVCQRLLDAARGDGAGRWSVALFGPQRISWRAAIAGAFVGTWSHVVLDGLMHADLRPFAPFDDAHPWLGAIGVGDLHAACLAAGLAGGATLVAVAFVRTLREA